jgi:hypothetical protein
MDFEAQFKGMFTKLQADPSALQAFISNPQPVLEAEGIPTAESFAGTVAASQELGVAGATASRATGSNYRLDVETKWWGVDFIMNEDLTQAIATGAIVGPPLAALFSSALAVAGIVTGPVAAVIGAGFATAIALKIVQIKFTDQGQGVYWPVSWIQWGGVIAAVPAGPGGVVAALIVFIHPIPN